MNHHLENLESDAHTALGKVKTSEDFTAFKRRYFDSLIPETRAAIEDSMPSLLSGFEAVVSSISKATIEKAAAILMPTPLNKPMDTKDFDHDFLALSEKILRPKDSELMTIIKSIVRKLDKISLKLGV